MDNQVFIIIVIAIVYAPLIVAAINGKRGGAIWKFLTFCLCTLAGILVVIGVLSPVTFALGIIAWLAAWATAALTRSSIRQRATSEATLKALQEQNELLKKQMPS